MLQWGLPVTHTAKWKQGELQDLGVIGAGPNSESNWLSESGVIAGDSQNGQIDPLVGAWELRGVVWKQNKLVEVGTLGGGYNSLAWAVNDSDEVVGFSTTTVPDDNAMILQLGLPYAYQTRAFLWKDGKIEDLGTLGGPDCNSAREGKLDLVTTSDTNASPPSALQVLLSKSSFPKKVWDMIDSDQIVTVVTRKDFGNKEKP